MPTSMPAVFVSIPGCSHCWQLERPDTVADELTRFSTAHRP
jgi:pimeloyl-ACP methyl ester carboxylesterase